jgi:hypothetical protein
MYTDRNCACVCVRACERERERIVLAMSRIGMLQQLVAVTGTCVSVCIAAPTVTANYILSYYYSYLLQFF